MTLAYPETEQLTQRIIGAGIEVHRFLGPGLLESTYEECLCTELADAGIQHVRQSVIPIVYKGRKLDSYYRPDIIVDATVIIEVKAVDKLVELHRAQMLTYLKHTGVKVGLVINFNCARLTDGIIRVTL